MLEPACKMEDKKQAKLVQKPSITQIPGEPAIIITGLSQLSSDNQNANKDLPKARDGGVSSSDYGMGNWFIGRKVMKKFGEEDYKGKVVFYDAKRKLYLVKYEDGDQEEMTFAELQVVLVPLDINMPLQKWLHKLGKNHKKLERTQTKFRNKKNMLNPRKQLSFKKIKANRKSSSSSKNHAGRTKSRNVVFKV